MQWYDKVRMKGDEVERQELYESWDSRWTIVKLYRQKNDFWAPDGDWTHNLLMTGETI